MRLVPALMIWLMLAVWTLLFGFGAEMDLSMTGVISRVLQHKLLFIETADVVATTYALNLYRQACDSGQGAVFLSVARGKVAEGIDFDRHYGRCVVLFGVPFQYTLSRELRARLGSN